jgi:hypothetical protein
MADAGAAGKNADIDGPGARVETFAASWPSGI